MQKQLNISHEGLKLILFAKQTTLFTADASMELAIV